MAVETHMVRAKIVDKSMHPYNHPPEDIGYSHPSLPGVQNLGQAFNWIMAVLYPNPVPDGDVATPGDLPLVGNDLRDYRVVLDDGDGKAAGYRWDQREGDASPQWYKIYDMDWGVGSVLSAFQDATQDLYVFKWGIDDVDEDGVALTGDAAGQRIFGGRSANTHLSLFANSGDGVGADTGYVQFGDNVRPLVDSQLSLGTTTNRWLKIWSDELTIGTLTITDGSIQDSDGLIDFGATNLETDGYMYASEFRAWDPGTAAAPAFFFEDDLETGMYLGAAGILGFSVLTNPILRLDAEGLEVVVAGTATDPSLRFGTGLGISRLSSGLVFSTAETNRFEIKSNGDLSFAANAGGRYIASSNRWAFGNIDPAFFFHVYHDTQAQMVLETADTTNASTFAFRRSRDAVSSIALNDDLGFLDWYGYVAGTHRWLAGIQSRYVGDATTRLADLIFATAGGADPLERMRIKYDGKVGIGQDTPLYQLHVVGDFGIDNILIDGGTISTTNTNGLLVLSPDGTGWVSVAKSVIPSTDGARDLGATGTRFQNLFLSGAIGDGTNTTSIATIIAFRDVLTGIASGMSIFWDGSKFVSSLPDTEVDHGTVSGLSDDDHTQYALLAGRGTSQVLKGGLASGNNLELWSTAHATQGSVIWKGILQPEGDLTRDIGTASFRVKDAYIGGQAIGLRLQNGLIGSVSASAGTIGLMLYDTTLQDIYVDRGGTWAKVNVERYSNQDASTWNGTAYTQTYDVSAEISDARLAIWSFSANGSAFLQQWADITRTQTHVTVTFPSDAPPASGTYTLLGIG